MDSPEILRQRMVKTQLMPEAISSAELLKAFGVVPREYFSTLEKNMVLAYQDDHLQVEADRFLTRPALLARLIEFANPQAFEKALYIGAMTGYGPFILRFLVQDVVAVEESVLLYTYMEQNQKKLKLNKISIHQGSLEEGCAKEGPYDLIFIEGAVEHIPPALLKQLKPEGRIVGVWQLEAESQQTFQIQLPYQGQNPSPQYAFKTSLPLLKAFSKKNKFTF
ncbi:MAG: protein-L-isoaspartate O-methyltransferase family protein [Alphaproteobacteria bacterium]